MKRLGTDMTVYLSKHTDQASKKKAKIISRIESNIKINKNTH